MEVRPQRNNFIGRSTEKWKRATTQKKIKRDDESALYFLLLEINIAIKKLSTGTI